MAILEEYIKKSNEYAPLPYGTHYNGKIAEEKMKEAIKRNKPLTPNDFENVRAEGVYNTKEKK